MKAVTWGTLAAAVAIYLARPANFAQAQIFPEQRNLRIRGPAQLPRARMPDTPPPATVTRAQPEIAPRSLPLDEAVRIALLNAQVVRVLSGVAAVSSGRTIYDAPIANTAIDVENSRFDPRVQVDNSWNQLEQPQGLFDLGDPTAARIGALRSDDYRLGAAVVKENVLGGQARVGVDTDSSRFGPGILPLNPQDRASADISYTQPLLQGGGLRANIAPIVLARIDTQRSYFQFKDAVQEQVRGVIEAYWSLVAARMAVWVGERQVEQADFAFRLADALFRHGFTSGADRAQARVTRANFRASLVTARADVIQREAALRNILGLPPADAAQLVPVTPPADERLEPDWYALVDLAEERRPDLIELKLIIEADQQLLAQARNQALPQADAVALYRWNGLEGRTPTGAELRTGAGEFADWTLGVNFSVPLGRRRGRADVRRVELLLARDRADLRQGLHAAAHALATNVRGLDQVYEQYLAFTEAREAAQANLDQQLA
ncbi:MAG: TolC family protein, partial [Pirellulales bacterium]